MVSLKDLINLAKADGGKFFVVDEKGDASLVIMSIEDYQKLLLGKLQRQVADVESINKEILKAQLESEASEKTSASATPRSDALWASATGVNKQIIEAQLKEAGAAPEIPKPASSNFSPANPELFSPRPGVDGHRRGVDLREEVIDPSFDFEGPKVDIDDL